MMNLTAAINAARSSITARSVESAATAENISNVNNPNFTRRQTEAVSVPGGGVLKVKISRADDIAQFRQFLEVTSSSTRSQVIVDGLRSLERTIGDPETEMSPAALITKFQNALQAYASIPHDPVVAENAIYTANNLAKGLNDATSVVQQTRAKADADIGKSVDKINLLLTRFHAANSDIVRGSGSPSELVSLLDERDSVLAQLSQELDIRTVSGKNNDLAVYAQGGAVLYEKQPRLVSFEPVSIYSPNTVGNQVFIDGVRVTGNPATMGMNSGRLSGLIEVRDTISITFQNQLDEVARGLIEAFAETDQSAVPTLPDAAGLFSYTGGPAVPPTGTLVVGLAGQIFINPNVDSNVGGNVNLLRDGSISNPGNPAYTYNVTGAAGFSDRVSSLFDALSSDRTFDGNANLGVSQSLTAFSNSSASWFESMRANQTNDAEYKATLLARSSQALSQSTGVNLDNELALMMELERSYEASARLLSTIDSMFSTLLASMR